MVLCDVFWYVVCECVEYCVVLCVVECVDCWDVFVEEVVFDYFVCDVLCECWCV